MEELEAQQESRDQLGSLTFSPPPMRKSETRDSISSIDSDLSLSFDRRGSKGEEGDLSDSVSSDGEKGDKGNEIKSKENTKDDRGLKTQIIVDQKHSDRDSGADSYDDNVDEPTKIISNKIEKKKDESTTNLDATNDFVPPSDELAEKICTQVEFYFSDENIVKDAFLLKHVRRNKEGYVSLKLIASFKRVKHLSRDWRVVGAALARSKKLQVNQQGTKLRRVDPLPPFDQTAPSRTILAARLPVERLSVESVAEIFRPCGEIALIRVLKPGHPAPAEVRQAIARRPELASSEECAMVEFSDSASARAAIRMSLGDAKIFELQQIEKKRKQQPTKKTAGTRDEFYSSSCPSGSETEDSRTRHRRAIHGCSVYRVYPAYPFQGPPPPPPQDTRISRRPSSCSGSGSDTGYALRRLSSCSGSGSDSGTFSRRYSACSSSSESGYCHSVYQVPDGRYYQRQTSTDRRYSCAMSSAALSECVGPCACSLGTRRGSTDCGPFVRRSSACGRDSVYEAGIRRLSLCSSGSEQGNFCRPRSNSGLAMMHLPENVTRMPSGPDGTRGFGRPGARVNFGPPPVEPTH